VNDSGITLFNGVVGGVSPLASIITDALGTTDIQADISTTGAQTYNDPITLSNDVTLTGVGVGFNSTVDSDAIARNLTINNTAITTFGGAVGSKSALSNLYATGSTIDINADINVINRITLETSGGGVNQNAGSLSADELLLLGSGTYTLDQLTNLINAFAANVSGSVTFRNNQNLNVSTIAGIVGVTTTAGNISIYVNGDINVEKIDAQGNGTTTGKVLLDSTGSIYGVGAGTHITSAGDTELIADGIIGRMNVAGFVDNVLKVNVGGYLHLTIGSRSGSSLGTVGAMPVSGNLGGSYGKGYVIHPATIASAYPFSGDPSGYIFFNNKEIWPYITSEILNQLNNRSGLSAYFEIINPARNSTVLPYFYAYHPLTPMDYSAFDGIVLDVDAYDFIDGNLNLRDTNKLYPFYEEDQKKKKRSAVL
ncbi:MAG: hypothetical protein Q8O30_04730, partial [Candidatus Omnitrophota bacterium]|nr:hypothetical protein [Candidatus Omnitrophota bacterium]